MATSVAGAATVPLPPLRRGLLGIFRRDLLLAFRQRSDLANPLFFFVIVVSLFPMGVSPESGILERIAPGVLWIAALLSALLSVDSLFRQDYEDGSLELLLLSPQPLFTIVLGKALAHWMTTALPLVLISPFLGTMLYMGADTVWVLVASLLLGTPVLTLISAVGSALTVGLGKGGILIALIALPLYVPILVFGASAVQAAAEGLPYSGQLAYLAGLLVLALTLSPFAIAAGLRISVSG